MIRSRMFWLAAIVAWTFADTAAAQTVPDSCAALRNPSNTVRFAQIPDAPTLIATAKLIAAGGDGTAVEKDFPEHCRVEGQIAPTVGFVLRMPSKAWNGKYLLGGCGGPCGSIPYGRYDTALVRGYAVIATDMGHKGVGRMFQYHADALEDDYAFRSTHVTAVAGKEIVDAFYGKRASRNYFWGCSTGGRQGMQEMQIFPHDFEGIIAGAPPWQQTGHSPYVQHWGARANLDAGDKPILSADKLPAIHKAVLAACDANDGLADGVLQDPRSCRWQPSQMVCKSGATAGCLTEAEAVVVQKIYDGPRNSKGERLYFGQARGSEMNWEPDFMTLNGTLGTGMGGPEGAGNTMLTYSGFWYPPGPSYYGGRDFDFDRDPPRLAMKEMIYQHRNPDVRKFRDAGGKAILYHGWNDSDLIPPELSIDYYELVTRTMGGEEATKAFFRLLMAPSMLHCQYGPAGGEIDWLTVLENWVEKGEAPESVVAYQMRKEPYAADSNGRARWPRHPMGRSEYDGARPIYPYPDVAHFSGKGDPEDPSSWMKAPR